MLGSRRTDLVLLLVAIVWGSSYLTAKTATASAPVLTVLFLRYAISAVALAAMTPPTSPPCIMCTLKAGRFSPS